jgi:tetratricopeptide (TPR) repeat protein
MGAMQQRHEEAKLLQEFPAPPASATGKAAAAILYSRANALLTLGRTDEAALSMDRSLALNRDTDTLLGRARIAAHQNNPSLAKSLIDEALKRAPNNGRALLARMNELAAAGDYRGALAISDQLLKQFPDDLETHTTRIEIFLQLNQDDKAKSDLGYLLSKMPKAPVTQYYQAVFLARANNAAAAWKIAQNLPPAFTRSDPAYAVALSQMAINSNNVETGAAILATAVSKFPARLDLRLQLAALRLRQNSAEAAARVMAPAKDSTDPLALDMMGYIALQTDNAKDALDKLNRAHQAQPNNGEITFHLIRAMDANGNRNGAKGLLKTLLASNTKFDDLENARALAKNWH